MRGTDMTTTGREKRWWQIISPQPSRPAGLRVFYPATPRPEEGVAGPRGCVVVANHPALVSSLSSLPLLHRDDDPSAAPRRSPLGDQDR